MRDLAKYVFTIMTALSAMLFYSAVANSALKDDLKECLIIASDYNKGMPMNAGNGITVNAIGCKEEDNRIVLFYNSTIDTTKSSINVSSLKNKRTTAACTSPNTRRVLDFFDMEWIYYDSKSSTFMGSIKVKKEYCPQ